MILFGWVDEFKWSLDVEFEGFGFVLGEDTRVMGIGRIIAWDGDMRG